MSNRRRQKPCNLFVGSRRHFVSSQIYKKTSQSVMRVTLQPRGGGSGCVIIIRYCALLLIIPATKVKNQGSRRARLGQAIPAMLLEGARHGHTMGVVSGPGGGVPSRATFVEPSSPARSLRREWYDFLLYSQVTGAKPELITGKAPSADVLRLTLDCFECRYPFGAFLREQRSRKKPRRMYSPIPAA